MTWNAPRYEVQTNRHPALDGRRWGWIEVRGQLAALAYWHGEEERLQAEDRVRLLNQNDSGDSV